MTQTSHGDPALYPLYNPVITVNGAPPVVFLPILPFHPAPAPPPATPYLQPQSSPEAPLEQETRATHTSKDLENHLKNLSKLFWCKPSSIVSFLTWSFLIDHTARPVNMLVMEETMV